MDVAKAWQSPVDSRGSNEVSASSRRIICISDSPRNVCSVSRSLSRRIVSNARLRSMPRNSIDTRCRCALALSQRYPKSTSAVLRPRLNPDCDDKEYRRLNAAFQRRARQDKEQSLKEKCRLIEESNKMGRTRDLFREIKEITGAYRARCGAMKLSTGKVATEEKEVNEIWQQYTEELYRRDPNATDSFNENIYEDEPEVMETEVKEALRHIYDRKSAGCDGIPIELLKAGGEEAVKVITGLCNCIWKRKEWPKDWKKSVYVPIYKKGDKQECGNYRTIALISHASKVLLRVIQKRLEVFLIPELPIEQAGFRRGRGTRDHIANLRWMMEKAREHQRDLYMCFIDYKKAFDCVDHERLWVVLSDMGVPVHLIVTPSRKRQSERSLERQTTSTLGKECDRDVSSHHCYSTYTQKT